MTPKELLYIEDALGHEKHLKLQCQDFAEKFQNPELKALAEELAKRHQEIFDTFYKLL